MKAHLTKGDLTELGGDCWSPKGDWALWYNLTLNKCWQISIHKHAWQDRVPSGCGQTWKWVTDNLRYTLHFLPPHPHFMITNQFPLMCPIFHCGVFVSVPVSVITSSENLSAPFTKLLLCRKWASTKWSNSAEQKRRKKCYPETPAQMAFLFLRKHPSEVFCQ